MYNIYVHTYFILDAVFTYLCGQRIWEHLPCIIITGCGYPPLSVRALVKKLSNQFGIPVVGIFDYNVSIYVLLMLIMYVYI